MMPWPKKPKRKAINECPAPRTGIDGALVFGRTLANQPAMPAAGSRPLLHQARV
jgi:hypothetical protein